MINSKECIQHLGKYTRRTIILLIMILLSSSLMGFSVHPQAARTVRVGMYENPPKIYTDSSGAVTGFWAEIIQEIARQEGFRVEWVRGSWEENLARLAKNEIDVMPDVGLTTDRANIFAFANETVLTSWARLYVPQGSTIETIFDLEGKKIAGLQGSLNFDGPEGIKALTEKFNVHSTFVGLGSYDEVFQAVADGEVDGGISNKDFGDLNEAKYNLARSTIILQPTDLRFAFSKFGEMTPYLIGVFDRDIKNMTADPTSVYYRALEKYFGQNIQKTFLEGIPAWVYELIVLVIAAALYLLIVSILARRQVQRQTAELRASEERYRALLTYNPDPIFRLDSAGLILDYHSTPDSPLYNPSEKLTGRHISEILPAEMVQTSFERIKKALESGEVQSYETSLPMGGEPHDIEIRFAPSGKNEVIAILRDITVRKKAERELRESEKRYQTLTDTSPVGIFHTSREGGTIYVNPTYCQISGLKAEEALGYGWLSAVHPDDREGLSANWQEAASRQRISLKDYRFVRPDGSVAWVLGQAVPELDSNNQLVGFVGTVTDITERKQVEDLQIAVLRAESADRLKSAFLATMSHELRTPLNSIIGFTGILLQKLVGPLSGEQEKQLAMIQSSAHHLLELINDVLDISKIEAGQLLIVAEDFDMNQAVQKSLEKIQPLADKKGLKLSALVVPPAIPINTDRRRVEQILINLLNNAVKFTDQGEVRLLCQIDGQQVVTRVIDTGIGIKADHFNALFKPFQQVDSGLTRQYEGTGLGLSICQRLVELLGGRIWVESEPGRGSTFSFTLPLQYAAADSTEKTEQAR